MACDDDRSKEQKAKETKTQTKESRENKLETIVNDEVLYTTRENVIRL